MKKFFIALPFLIIACVAVFVEIGIKNEGGILSLKDGSKITADKIWQEEGLVCYKKGGRKFVLIKSEVTHIDEAQPKRLKRKELIDYWLDKFKRKTADLTGEKPPEVEAVDRKMMFYLAIAVGGLFSLILLVFLLKKMLAFMKRASLRKTLRAQKKKNQVSEEGTAYEVDFDSMSDQDRTVYFFLNLYKYQVGATEEAPAEFRLAEEEASGPNDIYELRVKVEDEWIERRMSIGPIGEDSGSKSKCFYVIYDIHMVIKLPPEPVTAFKKYINDINKERLIIERLAPKECIAPKVSVILQRVHEFNEMDETGPDNFEVRYIEWVAKYKQYQEYLKIGDTFVFFMDLSKYFFLGHIIDEMHDLKRKTYLEITERPDLVWNIKEFEGRYGEDTSAVCESVQGMYADIEREIKELKKQYGMTEELFKYQMQRWFLLHLAEKEIGTNEKGISSDFIKGLNTLIKGYCDNNAEKVEEYRNIIRAYLEESLFLKNRANMGGIIENTLELLAWLKERDVAMRDLKPDNLLVAGDKAKYPQFLSHPEDYSVGLIDVETAVVIDTSGDSIIEQPILGGTPYYATPSHLFSNDLLLYVFGNVAHIMHLQDWYATVVMIYKVITGKRLFGKSGLLLPGIAKKIQSALMKKKDLDDVSKDVSCEFWVNAVAEFRENTDRYAWKLGSVNLDLLHSTRVLLKEEFDKALPVMKDALKKYIYSQKQFASDKARGQILQASSKQLGQIKNNWEKKPEVTKEHIRVLDDIEYMKSQTNNIAAILKIVTRPAEKITALSLLRGMFDLVCFFMYQEKWGIVSSDDFTVSEIESVDNNDYEATI